LNFDGLELPQTSIGGEDDVSGSLFWFTNMTMFSADTMLRAGSCEKRELMNCILKVVCPEKGRKDCCCDGRNSVKLVNRAVALCKADEVVVV